jgi:hypothetical protein
MRRPAPLSIGSKTMKEKRESRRIDEKPDVANDSKAAKLFDFPIRRPTRFEPTTPTIPPEPTLTGLMPLVETSEPAVLNIYPLSLTAVHRLHASSGRVDGFTLA